MKILNLYAGIGGNRKLWGDEHCDFVERFAHELIELTKDYGELELIRGYNKAKGVGNE